MKSGHITDVAEAPPTRDCRNVQGRLCGTVKCRTARWKYKMRKTFQGFYLQQFILRSIWELFMEAVLQNFCNVSHAITTCKTKSMDGLSNSKTTCVHTQTSKRMKASGYPEEKKLLFFSEHLWSKHKIAPPSGVTMSANDLRIQFKRLSPVNE